MTLAIGYVLHNRYHIRRVLGQGGMATVYEAHDAVLNCPCAVKEMMPDPTASPQALAGARDQFRREAQVLATLRHPGLPRVIDHFQERGHAYLVMDFVEGESLAERLVRLKGRPLPEHLVVGWAEQLLEALEYCHRHNVIHRDIKPHNVIVTPDGRAVLVDFGLVKLYDPSHPGTATVVRGMGTPEYTPPEQYDAPGAGHTDARSDIYALGATLYHLVTGGAPPAVTQRMANPHSFRRPRPLNTSLSSQIESVILKALDIPQDRRFQTAAEMRAALAGQTRKPQTLPQAVPSRKAGFPAWVWALGGLIVLSLVVGLALGRGITQTPTPQPTYAPTATTKDVVATDHTPMSTQTPTPQPTYAPTTTTKDVVATDHTPTSTQTPTPQPTYAPTATVTPMTSEVESPKPTDALISGVKRGGTLHVASQRTWMLNSRGMSSVMRVTHPAQISWIHQANQLRQVAEYLTYTDRDNITHPWLLESWEASDDLKTWTLKLRKGIKFNNSDEFNADDVIFSMNEWLNPNVGSSMLGLMSYLNPNNIEKVDSYTVRLHLDRPELAVPEHLFHFPALILNHRTFEGDFLKAPHGTGPYTLEEYSVGERVLLKRRNDYWQTGADGRPLPYLDAIEFIDMGEETSALVAAIRAGEVDVLDPSDTGDIDVYLALKDDPRVNLLSVPTARTSVLRMRVDREPWSDNRVRQALKLCQNRERILEQAYFGEGLLGQDCHVAPIHPEYCEKPIPKYDPEKAKRLLAEAGYPDGLDVTITVGSGWPDIVSYAEILKQDAEPAGLRITINAIPNTAYWDVWTEADFAITSWTHRPLAVMLLPLAYTCDAEGTPVPWNESRWCDDEFDALLAKAMGTLDLDKRREIFCQLEQIQMDRGSIGIAYWQNTWLVTRKAVRGVKGHPYSYMLLNEVWLEE